MTRMTLSPTRVVSVRPMHLQEIYWCLTIFLQELTMQIDQMKYQSTMIGWNSNVGNGA